MNGFLAGTNDEYAIGYYVEADRPFHTALAHGVHDLRPLLLLDPRRDVPNRIFLHAAQTDRLENSLDLSTLPTIWDRLIEKGVSARYYFSDVSFLWLWGAKYLAISRPYQQFLDDAAAGTLPSVSFVEPRFIDEAHRHFRRRSSVRRHPQRRRVPRRDLRCGRLGARLGVDRVDRDLRRMGRILRPRRAAARAAPNSVDPDIVGGKALLGFRIPVVVASPFTRGDPANPQGRLRGLRQHVDPEADRVALESEAAHRARRVDRRRQPRVRARPREPRPERAVAAAARGSRRDPVPAGAADLEIGLSSLLELAPFGLTDPTP